MSSVELPWRKFAPPDLRWVEKMGTRLLQKHGLSNWTFGAQPLYRQPQYGDVIGGCCHDLKKIVVYVERTDSRYLIRQYILHEIAHALADLKAAHGPRWQKKARELGVSEWNISTNLEFARAKWHDVGCRPWQGVLAMTKPFRKRLRIVAL
jgi:hypothetical protein